MADLQKALRNAHNAGDTVAAQRIANMIKAQSVSPKSDRQLEPAVQPQPSAQWSDLPGNILPSIGKAATGLYETVRHPINTANAMYDAYEGGMDRLFPGVANYDIQQGNDTQENFDRQQQTSGAMGQMLKDRYGGADAIKNTMITDPFGAALDVSAVATGGGSLLSKAPMLGQAGKVLSTVGEFTNPINAIAKPIGSVVNKRQYIKDVLKGAPARSTVKAQADAAWKNIDNQNIKFDPNTYDNFQQNLDASFGGLDANAAPAAFGLRKSLSNLAPDVSMGPQAPVNFSSVDNLRKIASKMSTDGKMTDTEKLVASKILTGIENLYSTSPGLKQMLDPAKELSRRNIMAKKLEKMKDKSQWYVAGNESGLKNQVASLGKKEGGTLSNAEKAALLKVGTKEGLNNFVSTAGGRLGQLVLGGVGATLGSSLGPVGTGAGILGAGGVHALARKFSERSTTKAIDNAMKTFLLGKQGQALLTQIPKKKVNDQAIIRALLLGRSGEVSKATQ